MRNCLMGIIFLTAACGGKAIVDPVGGGGNDSSSSVTSVSSGVTVTSSGTGPPTTCDQLTKAHAALIAELKSCSPAMKDVCTIAVPSGLDCDCPTFINGQADDDVLETLAELHVSYATLGCKELGVTCSCAGVQGATCEGQGSSGECVDF